MAGGMSRRGAPLPGFLTEAAAARAAERGRAFCWVAGRDGEGGPWPGLVVEWVRADGAWAGRCAYLVTTPAGERRLVVEVVPAGRLRPR